VPLQDVANKNAFMAPNSNIIDFFAGRHWAVLIRFQEIILLCPLKVADFSR